MILRLGDIDVKFGRGMVTGKFTVGTTPFVPTRHVWNRNPRKQGEPMRNCVWILSVALTISTSGFASAQQNQLSPFTASSFLTGVQQQDIVFQKVVDVPDFPNLQMQRTTTDRFSLRQMLSKVVPFRSPSSKTS